MEENKSRIVKIEVQKSNVGMYSPCANFEGIWSTAYKKSSALQQSSVLLEKAKNKI